MSLGGRAGHRRPSPAQSHPCTGDPPLHVETRGKGFYDVTVIAAWARGEGMTTGLVTLFCRHTSASLVIQENADPAVLRDLERASPASRPRATASMSTTPKAPTICPPIFARR